jgi:hypothetical protein
MTAINIALWLYVIVGLYLLANTDTGPKIINQIVDTSRKYCDNKLAAYAAYCERNLENGWEDQRPYWSSRSSSHRRNRVAGSKQERTSVPGLLPGQHAYSEF